MPSNRKNRKPNVVCCVCGTGIWRPPSECRRRKKLYCGPCYLQHRAKYTEEMLQPIVAESFSYSEVVRKLGLRPHGGSNNHLKQVIAKFGIDTRHFLGLHWAKGRKGGTFGLIPACEILVLRSEGSRRQPAYKLRRALLEIGRPYICGKCGLSDIWNREPLVLQVDHRNGKIHDDQEDNLRFLCPNCHSQTANFGSKNSGIAQVSYQQESVVS